MIATRTALGVMLLGVALPVAAALPIDDIQSALDTATSTYRNKGYAPAGWEKFGKLANTTDIRVPVPLKAGESYQIVGACDGKCSDLDLQLFDAAGKEVDFDAQDDDFPIVAIGVTTAQTYSLRVVMSACSQSPCSFGAKAFVKNRTAAK